MAGRRGAPIGNKNGAKNKVWSDAIRRAAARRQGGLNKLADDFLEAVAAGDISAFKEFGDRYEGRVPQGIEGTGENGEINLKLTVEYVSADNGKSAGKA